MILHINLYFFSILTNKYGKYCTFLLSPYYDEKNRAPVGHKKTRANATISRCFSVQTTFLHTVIRTIYCTESYSTVAYGPLYSLYGAPI